MNHVYSSLNLADWKFENDILRGEGPLAVPGWAGRPGLLHNRPTKKYVVIFEADSRQWERHKVGCACCDAIDGNYAFIRYVYPQGNCSTGDQSVYQEGNDAYLVCTLDKIIDGKRYLNQSLAIFKLTSDYLDIEKKLYEGFDNVNGDRYSQHHGQGVGRNIFLPLVWQDGVPTLTWYSKWQIDVETGRWEAVRQ